MGNIVMWIILGSLIFVVAVFLIITSILDKKKEKIFKERKAEESKERQASVGNVAIWINEISKNNDALLRTFVPSIGELKMKDVRNKARISLKELLESRAYAMAKASEDGEVVVKHVKALDKENANNWAKNCKKELDYFAKIESNLEMENYTAFKEKTEKVVKGHYESAK